MFYVLSLILAACLLDRYFSAIHFCRSVKGWRNTLYISLCCDSCKFWVWAKPLVRPLEWNLLLVALFPFGAALSVITFRYFGSLLLFGPIFFAVFFLPFLPSLGVFCLVIFWLCKAFKPWTTFLTNLIVWFALSCLNGAIEKKFHFTSKMVAVSVRYFIITIFLSATN